MLGVMQMVVDGLVNVRNVIAGFRWRTRPTPFNNKLQRNDRDLSSSPSSRSERSAKERGSASAAVNR